MYNPYDLIKIKINNHELYGRPVAFDSEPVDSHTLLNKEGDIIRPTRITSVCPDCGQGLELEIRVENPPFSMSYECHLCNIKKNKSFVNKPKIESSDYKTDPLLRPNIIIPLNERLSGFVENDNKEQLESITEVQENDIPDLTPDSKKKAKRPKRKPRKATPKKTNDKQVEDFVETKKVDKQLDKAEGITEEVDLDDTDMIETE